MTDSYILLIHFAARIMNKQKEVRIMKYTMYKYDAATELWNIYQTFEDKDELLRFLCYGTQTHNGLPRRRWTNKYFDEQNLTCKDILVKTRWEKQYDVDGNPLIRYGMPVYSPFEYRTIREWHLEDSEGRTVDANIFKEEVYDMVEQMSFYMRNTLSLRKYKRQKTKQRMGRAWHHAIEFRCSSKNHRYSRMMKTAEETADDCEELLTQHQMQVLKVKPKDMYAKYRWGDDFWRHNSTNWKEHKNSKQWEAKQKRVDAVWIENIDKHQHSEMLLIEEDVLESA